MLTAIGIPCTARVAGRRRNLKETRAFWRFRRNGPEKVNKSFNRQRQLSRRRVQRALDDQWPNEPPFLQTLREKTQAGAVLGQNLHVVGARGARAGARIWGFIAMDVGRLGCAPHIDALRISVPTSGIHKKRAARSLETPRLRRNGIGTGWTRRHTLLQPLQLLKMEGMLSSLGLGRDESQ